MIPVSGVGRARTTFGGRLGTARAAFETVLGTGGVGFVRANRA